MSINFEESGYLSECNSCGLLADRRIKIVMDGKLICRETVKEMELCDECMSVLINQVCRKYIEEL